MSIEAMKQAADKLEIGLAYPGMRLYHDDIRAAITALLTAIAEAEKQEPVAWANINKHGDITHTNNKRMPWSKTPLYTAPPAAQQKPLTDAEVLHLWAGDTPRPVLGKNKVLAFARTIEAAHGVTGEKK